MADPYFAFVAAAYGISALSLAGLGLWTYLDARRAGSALKRLQDSRTGAEPR